jgi:pimeloyl-ACP methyl ester carboxylesterase
MTQAESIPSVIDGTVAYGTGGTHIATASGGGGDPETLFVHATGFCKEVWVPVIGTMAMDPFPWLSMDLRGHGDSGSGDFPYRWDLLGGDVLAVVDGRTSMIGVGHSCGGAALVRAEAARPGTFRQLVLIEPIIFPTPARRLDGPMSAVARKRRSVFASRHAAKERFRHGPFSTWTEQSLDAYLDGGFIESEDGFELKCAPAVEADYYAEGSNHDTWDLVESLDIPVTLVAGEFSDSHQEPFLGSLVSRFRHGKLVVVEGVGHLVPMENPEALAQIIDHSIATS